MSTNTQTGASDLINKIYISSDNELRTNLSIEITSYIIGFHRLPNKYARKTKFTNDLLQLANEIESFSSEVEALERRLYRFIATT